MKLCMVDTGYVGNGGSCLGGRETVLVRSRSTGRIRLLALESLFHELAPEEPDSVARPAAAEPDGLEVLAWEAAAQRPVYRPLSAVTRRPYEGRMLEIRTTTGHTVTCTPDHPFVVIDPDTGRKRVELADSLTTGDWLPCALGPAEDARPAPTGFGPAPHRADAGARFDRPRIPTDERFWWLLGLYLSCALVAAEADDGVTYWVLEVWPSTRELARQIEVCWRELGFEPEVHPRPRLPGMREADPSLHITLSVSALRKHPVWARALGLDYERGGDREHAEPAELCIPDDIWTCPASYKRALIAGLCHGQDRAPVDERDGLELGLYVEPSQADAICRLLCELGLVCQHDLDAYVQPHRYELAVRGTEPLERFLELPPPCPLHVVAPCEQPNTGDAPSYWHTAEGTAALQLSAKDERFEQRFVYSLEVPGAHTFVTTAGLVVHNCLP